MPLSIKPIREASSLLKSIPSKQLDKQKPRTAFWGRRKLIRGKNRFRTRMRLMRESFFGTADGKVLDVLSWMLLMALMTMTTGALAFGIVAIMRGCCKLLTTLTTTE